MVNLTDIAQSLQSGKAMEASSLISRAIAEDYSFESILKQGLLPGINAVQERLNENGTLTDLLAAGRAMNIGIKTLRPCLVSKEMSKGTAIIGTVKGDPWDMEKNLIAIAMEGLGLRVVDLGAGVSTEQFLKTAVKEKARIILCTASLATTMVQMKNLVQALTRAGLREEIKIILAGMPVTEHYCHAIGADLYARDAVSAAEMALANC
jgi:methanogenic corrinoid protein MtbC1